MDETYIRVKGEWVYLYRAVDKFGKTIDSMLSKKRDEAAATAFFTKAIGRNGLPYRVVIDKSGSNDTALININWMVWIAGMIGSLIEVLQVKYLNNMVEQSHRPIKRRMMAVLGFKSWEGAESTIAGVETWQMLRKGLMENAGDIPAWKQFYALAG